MAKKEIKFIKFAKFAISISVVFILIGVWFMFGNRLIDVNKVKLYKLTPKGLQYGIDFKGGVVFQIKIYSGGDAGTENKGITIDQIRAYSVQAGLGNEVQEIFINENKKVGKAKSFIIKTSITAEEQKIIDEDPALNTSNFIKIKTDKFYDFVKSQCGDTYILKDEELAKAYELYPDGIPDLITDETGKSVKPDNKNEPHVIANVVKESTKEISPAYSKALKWQAMLLILFVFAVMLIYITFRFKFKYGVGAILALLHDVLMMLGLIAFTGLEIDYTIIAAILFIIGYSINDTIVVFDRIRENFSIMKDSSEALIIDSSITQTLSRTVITSLTTFLAIFALLMWGGEKIYGFSLVVTWGLLSGTYSSIFIASPIVEVWDRIFGTKKYKANLKAKKEEQKIIDDRKKIESNDINAVNDENSANAQTQQSGQKIFLSKKQLKKLSGDKKK